MDIVVKLMELPCRAEDILYVLDNKCENGIDECKIICLKLFKKQIRIQAISSNGNHRKIHPIGLNRWVFTTREGAELVREKAKNKHNN
mgnify:CR=1 FL=1